MKDYVVEKNGNSPSDKDETVWAFDLGKRSIGEAVRRGTEFLHKASLLIPAELANATTAARRQRITAFGTGSLNQMAMLQAQIQNLRRTRDLLLPRLLSGRVNLKEN